MKRVNDSVTKPPSGLVNDMKELGFKTDMWFSKDYCNEFCKDKNVRIALSKFANNALHLIQPGGKKLSKEEREQKIIQDSVTAGRVLYGLREHRMAKYICS